MDRTVGLLGGGQLGQMLCEAAGPLGIKVVVLDAESSPAKQVNARNPHIDGSFIDPDKIRELARQCDILTVEIEHVDTQVLEEIAEQGVEVFEGGKVTRKKVEVQPSWRTLRVIQDKFDQKEHLLRKGVSVVDSEAVNATAEALKDVGDKFGYPYMLKARKDAYDGRGNFPIKSVADIEEALSVLKNRQLYAEKWVNFRMELAVMVVKTAEEPGHLGSTISYPAVETIHEDSVCKLVYAPARGISEEIRASAQRLASKAVSSFWGKGIFGVELFLTEDDTLLLNEIAPRCHNSGHYTIEACPTQSQFKSHLLSVLGLMPPLATIEMVVPAAIMLNIIGGVSSNSHDELRKKAIVSENTSLHMYGKVPKPGRKIGHLTLLASSISDAKHCMAPLLQHVDAIRKNRLSSFEPPKSAIPSSPLP